MRRPHTNPDCATSGHVCLAPLRSGPAHFLPVRGQAGRAGTGGFWACLAPRTEEGSNWSQLQEPNERGARDLPGGPMTHVHCGRTLVTQPGAAVRGNGRPELAPQATSTFPSIPGNDEGRGCYAPSAALAHLGDLQNTLGGWSHRLQLHK